MDIYDSGGSQRLPARAWRVLYRSTSATGAPIAVSGTVLVPEAPTSGERRIVAYSIGTRGIADRCAPSRNLATGAETEANTIRRLLERGWAVTVSDLQGLGTPGDHTYLVGRAEGQAVLDAVRAGRRLQAAGLPANGPLALLGYSQGGHSTSWAAQAQPTYAPELKVTAAAAGATPSDLNRVSANVDGGPAAGLVIYAAIGMSAAYPELQLDRYLNAAGRDAVARGRDSCITDGSLAGFAFRRSSEYTTEDLLRRPDWQARLVENRVGALAPQAPMLVYHARVDNLIPFPLGTQLRDEWCRRGVNAQFMEVPGADHISGTTLGTPLAIDWLAERFATGPPPQDPDCRADSGMGAVSGKRFVISRRTRRAGRRTAPVVVSCRQATTCKGTLRLRARFRQPRSGVSRRIRIGQRTFSVAAGKRQTLRVKISPRGLRLLRNRRKVRVIVGARLREQPFTSAGTATIKASYRLLSPRPIRR